MAQVTSPIILDSTGQQIHSDLQQIKNVLTTPSTAADISFDNTGTGMQADDVQDAITELKSNLTYNEDHVTGTTEFTVPASASEVIIVCCSGGSSPALAATFKIPNPRVFPIDIRPTCGYYGSSSATGFIQIDVNHTTGKVKLNNFIMNGTDSRSNCTTYFYYR